VVVESAGPPIGLLHTYMWAFVCVHPSNPFDVGEPAFVCDKSKRMECVQGDLLLKNLPDIYDFPRRPNTPIEIRSLNCRKWKVVHTQVDR